jgi:hypothetical protein
MQKVAIGSVVASQGADATPLDLSPVSGVASAPRVMLQAVDMCF